MKATDRPTLLVMAKAPVIGQVKTRLAADLGDRFDIAADLAAAALLDTLDACARTQCPGELRVALDGDIDQAVRASELKQALSDWTVVGQRGVTFADRLAHAHAEIDGPVIQVGMDSPQLPATTLDDIAAQLAEADAVLGPTPDGGWWVLGWRTGRHGPLLRNVPMSTPTTGQRTRAALLGAGLRTIAAPMLTDVDHLCDAFEVADQAPGTRFASALRSWGLVRGAA